MNNLTNNEIIFLMKLMDGITNGIESIDPQPFSDEDGLSSAYNCAIKLRKKLFDELERRIRDDDGCDKLMEAEHDAKVITLGGLSNYRRPVWMLEKTSSGMVGHWRKPFSGFDTGIYACFEEECYLVEEYGKAWLPWTKKPTNKRIKAVRWK